MKKPCVLVTGGGGFLGQAIVERCLLRGYTVRVAGRRPLPKSIADKVDFRQGNLVNQKFVQNIVEGCDYIFHVAAKAGICGKWEDYVESNITATHHLITAARVFEVKAFVYTSTPSVVFTGESFNGANESLPYGKNWLCAYAETKATAEKIVLKAASPHLLVCALRPHLIWGPGDHHLFPRILASARKGKLKIIGDGKNKVDVTHVDTAANVHLQALDALLAGRANGKSYFISQGKPVKLWEFINRLLIGADIPPVTQKISLKSATFLGGFFETLWTIFRLKGEPPLTRFVAVEMAKDHWFDVSAAQKDLGLKPAHDTWSALDALAISYRKSK
jgi:nucleoside-diphosphate-sugar epimerase